MSGESGSLTSREDALDLDALERLHAAYVEKWGGMAYDHQPVNSEYRRAVDRALPALLRAARERDALAERVAHLERLREASIEHQKRLFARVAELEAALVEACRWIAKTGRHAFGCPRGAMGPSRLGETNAQVIARHPCRCGREEMVALARKGESDG